MKKAFNYIRQFYRVLILRKSIKNKRASIDEIVKSKFNFLGSSKRKHKGLKLFAFDPMTEIVSEVPMIDQGIGNTRAFFNPDSILVWAINFKNAKRKLDGNKSHKLVV